MPEPTRAEAERVLASAKTIGENVTWRSESSRTPRWRFEATVIGSSPLDVLKLCGFYGRKNWRFTLLMRQAPIRRFDFQYTDHRNPDRTIISQPHKHLWDDEQGNREVYVPDDIDITDVNRAFYDFLTECNIVLVGDYQSLVPF